VARTVWPARARDFRRNVTEVLLANAASNRVRPWSRVIVTWPPGKHVGGAASAGHFQSTRRGLSALTLFEHLPPLPIERDPISWRNSRPIRFETMFTQAVANVSGNAQRIPFKLDLAAHLDDVVVAIVCQSHLAKRDYEASLGGLLASCRSKLSLCPLNLEASESGDCRTRCEHSITIRRRGKV